MLILKESTFAEFTINNSRFAAGAASVDSPANAKEVRYARKRIVQQRQSCRLCFYYRFAGKYHGVFRWWRTCRNRRTSHAGCLKRQQIDPYPSLPEHVGLAVRNWVQAVWYVLTPTVHVWLLKMPVYANFPPWLNWNLPCLTNIINRRNAF